MKEWWKENEGGFTILLLVLFGFSVFMGVTYLLVSLINWLGFYGNSACMIGILLMVILGLWIGKPQKQSKFW